MLRLSAVLLLALTTLPAVEVAGPFARATAPQQVAAGVFLTLQNPGTAPVDLVAATTTAADHVELHRTETGTDGLKRMVHIERIAIPAGGAVRLAPGDLHLMLIGLKAPLKEGTRVPLTLTFSDGTTTAVEVPVLWAGATAPEGAPACCGNH